MSTQSVERKVRIKELACASFELGPDELTETTLFTEDLGVDSLNAIDLLAALETAFGIEIDQEKLTRMVSLEAVYEVVAESAGWALEGTPVRQ